ncbi:hypothetical protein [Aestuariicoccus sp. MJ-SS9]|uniref:hypothetical protein n=1 Tax=Aestuariicoccus sp. MJ-SS9 TaxID=3079855 RepID=UPI0029075D94|nr:hypothetical protein [Aestuariicoccus sp. MJ-SS9]MDU8911463.1 hypothetical protein [Aestuariicoccus sp. MJ-SS9]
MPGTFLLGAAVSAGLVWWDLQRSETVEAEVVQVHSWPGDTPFDFWTEVHAPVFAYARPDGSDARVSGGMRHPSLNLPLGSRHVIHVVPGEDRDGIYPGPHIWAHVRVVAALGLVVCLPALWGSWRLRRWLLQ